MEQIEIRCDIGPGLVENETPQNEFVDNRQRHARQSEQQCSRAPRRNPTDARKRDQQNHERPGKDAHFARSSLSDPNGQHFHAPQSLERLDQH